LQSFRVDQTQIKRLRWNRNLDIPGITHNLTKGRLLTFAGIPGQGSVPISYWRKQSPIPEVMDLDRDRCGFLWVAVTAPASGTDSLTIVPVIEQFFRDYGFEAMIVLDAVNTREMYVMTSLIYDREIPGQDEQAQKCFENLVAELRTMGYYQYRLPKALSSPNTLPERNDDYALILPKLRSSLTGNIEGLQKSAFKI
nr:hypothetical protein [Xenococcaceae cyanobacterium MO_167.B52]